MTGYDCELWGCRYGATGYCVGCGKPMLDPAEVEAEEIAELGHHEPKPEHEAGCEGCQIVGLMDERDRLLAVLDQVRDWALRRAVHGGNAHLSELQKIVGES